MLARYAWLAEDALRPLLFDLALADGAPTRGLAAPPPRDPPVEVFETATGIDFVCEVPGATPEDVQVTLENGELTLRARRRPRYPEGAGPKGARVPFELTRTFALGDGADPDQITASLAHGLLTVHVGKKPAPTPKKIPIQVHGEAPPPAQLRGEGAAPQP